MIVLWLVACISSTTTFTEVDVSGEVESTAAGTIYGEVHHAFTGQGVQRYPLGLIDEFEMDGAGEFDLTVLVPAEDGEGLVVYAWQDVDGDGALCAPGVDDEPVGLTKASDFPAFDVVIDVTLDAVCVGSEAMYP